MRVEQTEVYRRLDQRPEGPRRRARILVRVDRLVHGNPGSHRHLTDGVSELKIDVGPGYRVYYTQRGDRLLLPWWVATSPRRPKTFNAPSSWRKALRMSMAGLQPKGAQRHDQDKTKTKTVPYDVAEQLRTPRGDGGLPTPGLMKRPTTWLASPAHWATLPAPRACPRSPKTPASAARASTAP